MSTNKKIYLAEVILLGFILLLKFVLVGSMLKYYQLINALFWIIYTLVVVKVFGLQKGNKSLNETISQVTIIFILVFILLTYLSGLFFGFLKNPYSLAPVNIILNIYSPVIMVVCEEIVRFVVARKCIMGKITPLIVLTALFCLLDIFLSYSSAKMSGMATFVLITTTILPGIARNIVASYLSYKVSMYPGLILRLFYTVYVYVMPIFPNYGNYISSIIGLLVPYLIFMTSSKIIIKYLKTKDKPRIKKAIWYLNIPFIAIIVFVVILISGVLKYQIIAIGSGSMEPVIKMGDAVIFEHTRTDDQKEEIQEGMVIVFKHNGELITHRVKSIDGTKGKHTYQTKGDNNSSDDYYKVDEENVIGIVKFKIDYIGYPTLWFSELLQSF
ncbi:MAG TPA: signal peptidase I [Bacilli bacterium]|nr:signal peptidase I [Bacilli bacterium]